ncbi:YbjN domain-containing protein [Magnetococcus sp. PR-3]|uniref:YbjN domain-containing protein n=1 Tax=Magnetococcus sp. PR-3 TaxID=3120355 RepID=UPI002FCE3DC7
MSEQNHFETVRGYLDDLEVNIDHEDTVATLFRISDVERGIANMLVDCEDDLLVIEQVILEVSGDDGTFYKRLLQMNRELVHGAFVLDEQAKWVLFRDTLQLANLDLNELEASVNALGLGLASYAEELIQFANGSAA